MMQAIKIVSAGKAQLRTVPIPTVPAGSVLIRIEAVALNPSDWKNLDWLAAPGGTLGNDLAGTVVEIGSGVTTVKIGDRVAAFIHGSNLANLEEGTFAEYATARPDLLIRLPDNMSFEEGSTLGIASCTIALGLYQKLGLAPPNAPTSGLEWILVNAGSSAMGTFAIQMLKLSGYQVVTTCSPRNFDLVKSFGADAIFDYNSTTCAQDIRELTSNQLYYAFDIQSDENSMALCAEVLSTDTGARIPIYSRFARSAYAFPRDDVKAESTFSFTIMGEALIAADFTIEPKPDDYAFGKHMIGIFNALLQDGKIRTHPIDLRPGGLSAVLEALDDLRKGRVTGKKIVISLKESVQ